MSAQKSPAKPDATASNDKSSGGILLVISGPAGVGKDTIWKIAGKNLPTFTKAITCTTRARRDGETEGANYFFVSDEEFDRMIRDDELLEWAHVHGYRYGVPQSSVLQRLNNDQDVVCVIDVQGAQRIRSLFATRALLVFIKPPAGREAEILRERIEARGSADGAEIERRLQTAAWELTHLPLYDYHIENENVEVAARELCEIVEKEKAKRAE